MTENFRPLNDEDINQLDDLLATSSCGDDTFDVSMLDGFLSAIALLNPPLQDDSEWYPYIFNEEGTPCEVDEPETVKRLVTQRLQEIRAFQAQRHFYNPIVFPLEDEEGKQVTGPDGSSVHAAIAITDSTGTIIYLNCNDIPINFYLVRDDIKSKFSQYPKTLFWLGCCALKTYIENPDAEPPA